MNLTTVRLVTIIAEPVLKDRLIHEIQALGAHGYTISEVHGEGTRGIHASQWQGGNVKIETIVSPEVAERIVEVVADQYFPNYAVIAYVIPVQVVRGEKFA
ncbi:P-II family nitrogen regulator [Roseiflexus sp.]|uniref:P-II family nitrogen regulator n=1 Tax=Roseiflexus sp. TaxID=2562120 RepID=UPI00398A68BB